MAVAYVSPETEQIPCLRGIVIEEVDEAPEGTVYLIHLDVPFVLGKLCCRHYIGWSSCGHFLQRMKDHRNGRGAKFLRMVLRAGITWHVARVWPGDPKRERQIKRQGGASRCCPSCGIIPDAQRQLLRDARGRYAKLPRRTP